MKLDWISWRLVALVAILVGAFSFLTWSGKLPEKAVNVVFYGVEMAIAYFVGRIQKQPDWAKGKPDVR